MPVTIITMVDAETFTPDHFESEAALKQITYADVTIVNNVDLASLDQVKTLSELRNIFQLSNPRFSIDGEEWSTPAQNQLVFIGRHLNGDDIQQQLTACLV